MEWNQKLVVISLSLNNLYNYFLTLNLLEMIVCIYIYVVYTLFSQSYYIYNILFCTSLLTKHGGSLFNKTGYRIARLPSFFSLVEMKYKL